MHRSDTTKWEYGVVESNLLEDLNDFGTFGWEFVAPVRHGKTYLVFKKSQLTFREQVTLDQRRRYFASRGIDIEESGGKQAS